MLLRIVSSFCVWLGHYLLGCICLCVCVASSALIIRWVVYLCCVLTGWFMLWDLAAYIFNIHVNNNLLKSHKTSNSYISESLCTTVSWHLFISVVPRISTLQCNNCFKFLLWFPFSKLPKKSANNKNCTVVTLRLSTRALKLSVESVSKHGHGDVDYLNNLK